MGLYLILHTYKGVTYVSQMLQYIKIHLFVESNKSITKIMTFYGFYIRISFFVTKLNQ